MVWLGRRRAAGARAVDRRRVRASSAGAAPRRSCRRSRRPTRGSSRCSGRACSRLRDRPAASSARRRCGAGGSSAGSPWRPSLAAGAGIGVHGGRDGATSSPSATGSRRRRGSGRPTSSGEPPPCDGPMGIGPSARIGVHLEGDARRPVDRQRSSSPATAPGTNVRWLAYAATSRELGLHGAARIGERGVGPRAVQRAGGGATPAEVADGDARRPGVPRRALAGGRGRRPRSRGVDVIEGARAAAVPDRDRRPDVPARRSRRSRGSSATLIWRTGAASSTTGSSSTARSGRIDRQRQRRRGATSSDGRPPGDDPGRPDGDRSRARADPTSTRRRRPLIDDRGAAMMDDGRAHDPASATGWPG